MAGRREEQSADGKKISRFQVPSPLGVVFATKPRSSLDTHRHTSGQSNEVLADPLFEFFYSSACKLSVQWSVVDPRRSDPAIETSNQHFILTLTPGVHDNALLLNLKSCHVGI